jgi:hypothetical protein
MKVRKIVDLMAIVALVVLSTIGCGAPLATTTPTAEPTKPYDPAQVYAVYSALLLRDPEAVVVEKEVIEKEPSSDVAEGWGQGLPEIDEAAWKDLLVRGDQQGQLENSFDPALNRVYLVETAELTSLLIGKDRRERCEAFADKYPGARLYYSFSRVAFNPQMDKALVYMSSRDCHACGYMGLFWLIKINGKWTVQNGAEVISYGC